MIQLHKVEDSGPLRGQRAGSAECLSDQETLGADSADSATGANEISLG